MVPNGRIELPYPAPQTGVLAIELRRDELENQVRIKLTTCRLRVGCSITELLVHDWLRVADSNDRFPGYELGEMTASLTRIEFW